MSKNPSLQIPDPLLKTLAWLWHQHRVDVQVSYSSDTARCKRVARSWYLLSSGRDVLCNSWWSDVLMA